MRVDTAVHAAGNSHPGLLRDSNEDRFHCDPARGLFIVIDGVGGHAAGEKAADTALAKLREHLERSNGRVEERIRTAIARANNEVHRVASLRPEWMGMACVLTLAVLDNGDAVVGHVGDTRLYKLRGGRIEKLTRDHSPVGEREDDGELSEQDAMRHPRRNEVYRDVGSEPHQPNDPEFVDVFRVPFEPDAALLLCSDGLTDAVESATINAIVQEYAGHAYEIVRALIDAANKAGGKDNVTVVYVEGTRFVAGEDTRDVSRRPLATAKTAAPPRAVAPEVTSGFDAEPRQVTAREGVSTLAIVLAVLIVAITAAAYVFRAHWIPLIPLPSAATTGGEIVVAPGESIMAAMAKAAPGSVILVEPGDYRERLIFTNGVRVRSRVPRAAIIRMPAAASESDVAVAAIDLAYAELAGFRIVGDVAAPLGTGVLQRNATLNLVDVEITGARSAALEFGTGAAGTVLASTLQDNPGLAMVVRTGASPRVAYCVFARNATASRAAGPMVVEAGGRADLQQNIFYGSTVESLLLRPEMERAVAAENWFIAAPPERSPQRPAPPRSQPQRSSPRGGRGR